MASDVVQSVARELVPQRLVPVKPHDGVGERLRSVGNQYVESIAQVHALDGRRSRHHGLAMCHAQIDLAFHSGAKAQRCHRQAHAVHVRIQVGHVAVDVHALLLRQCLYFRGWIGTNAVEDDAGQLRANRGKHLLHEPVHRIHVRRVPETAHEQQVLALGEGKSLARDLMQVGNHFNACVGRISRK